MEESQNLLESIQDYLPSADFDIDASDDDGDNQVIYIVFVQLIISSHDI